MKPITKFIFTYLILIFYACSGEQRTYDVLIKNGQIFDGSGEPAFIGDIGINADTIADLGKLGNAKGIHQYAELGYGIFDRGRKIPKRYSAGRHPRGFWRRLVYGPFE